jgi:hypothetical protein
MCPNSGYLYTLMMMKHLLLQLLLMALVSTAVATFPRKNFKREGKLYTLCAFDSADDLQY